MIKRAENEMMKVGSLLLFSIFLLLGCANDEQSNDEYSQFLAGEEGVYTLYSVAEEEEQIPPEFSREYDHVNTIYNIGSLENALSEIEEIPYYLVFDTEDKIYETNDREELIEFLEEN